MHSVDRGPATRETDPVSLTSKPYHDNRNLDAEMDEHLGARINAEMTPRD